MKVDEWIEEQKRLVEMGGQTANTFLLEGPDGKTWATFPAAAEELGTMVNEAQRGLEGQLASGQVHSAKWVSLDVEGRQLACLPVVLRGQSNEAAGAAKDSLAFTRATGQHLLASEQLVTMWRNLADRLSKELEEERQENAMLREALVTLRDSNVDVELERTRALNDERRMDAALEEFRPLLGVATNIIGEKVMKWVKEQEEEKARGKRKRKPRSQNGASTADAGTGASGTTPEARLALHAQSDGSEAPVSNGGRSGNKRASRARSNGNGAPRNGSARGHAAKGPRKVSNGLKSTTRKRSSSSTAKSKSA